MSKNMRKTKLRGKDRPSVTFKDVAGVDEAKQDLKEILDYLQDHRKFSQMGARIPKGVLLYGPPGSGKTLLARALAGEAGVPFFSVSGSDFVELYVGMGASRVRALFRDARKNAPCIVFIDEIDAVGRQRGTGLGGGHDEREQTLNQLLVEMDGFAAAKGIVVIAATNRPDILDPALMRSGRFDRRIIVDQPDVKGRLEILKVHTTGKPIGPGVNLELVARRTAGFSGADISNMVNEAALLAIRKQKKQLDMAELEEAVDRVLAGPERKSRVVSEEEKKIAAYHEAGHALAGLLVAHASEIYRVSIVPRSRAGGYTLSLPKEERNYVTKAELFDEIKVLLAGRMAELLVLGEISTGAQNDLTSATENARKMVCEYGMSELIGPIAFGQDEEQVFLGRDISRGRQYSEEVASVIDAEIRRMIGEAYREVEAMIKGNIDKLHLIANALLLKETLDGAQIDQLLEKGELRE